MAYEYIKSSELAALAKRERIVQKTKMLGMGISNELAERLLSLQERCIMDLADEIADEIFKGGAYAPEGIVSRGETNKKDNA